MKRFRALAGFMPQDFTKPLAWKDPQPFSADVLFDLLKTWLIPPVVGRISVVNTFAEAVEELRQYLAVRLHTLVVGCLLLGGTVHFDDKDDDISFSVTVGTVRLAQTAFIFVTLVTSSRQVKADSSRPSPKHQQRLPSLTLQGQH